VAVEGTRAPSDDPAAPDRRGPAAGGTFASGAPAGPLFAGGVALLAIALSLAGPALSRRLVIRPAFCRSAGFVSPLERPG